MRVLNDETPSCSWLPRHLAARSCMVGGLFLHAHDSCAVSGLSDWFPFDRKTFSTSFFYSNKRHYGTSNSDRLFLSSKHASVCTFSSDSFAQSQMCIGKENVKRKRQSFVALSQLSLGLGRNELGFNQWSSEGCHIYQVLLGKICVFAISEPWKSSSLKHSSSASWNKVLSGRFHEIRTHNAIAMVYFALAWI